MSGGLGPLGSRACGELVKEFYQCRRQRGMIGMLAGDCSTLFQDMQVCLDEEVGHSRADSMLIPSSLTVV